MKLDNSAWIRTIVSSIVLAILICTLKILSQLNPERVYILINLMCSCITE